GSGAGYAPGGSVTPVSARVDWSSTCTAAPLPPWISPPVIVTPAVEETWTPTVAVLRTTVPPRSSGLDWLTTRAPAAPLPPAHSTVQPSRKLLTPPSVAVLL